MRIWAIFFCTTLLVTACATTQKTQTEELLDKLAARFDLQFKEYPLDSLSSRDVITQRKIFELYTIASVTEQICQLKAVGQLPETANTLDLSFEKCSLAKSIVNTYRDQIEREEELRRLEDAVARGVRRALQ